MAVGTMVCVCQAAAAAGSGPTYQPGAFRASGWNTWDVERPNAMIYLPDGISLELTIYDPQTGKSFGRPFLKNVLHFGAHAPDGSYCFARYKQGDLSYEVEFASRGENLVAHVHPLGPTGYLLVAEVSFFFGRTGTVEKDGARLLVGSKSTKFYAASPNPEKVQSGVSDEHRMVWDLTGDRWITVAAQAPPPGSEATCRNEMDGLREAYEKARVRSGGFLEDGAQAASDDVAWNMVWNPRHDMPVVTVAREFPAGSGIGWGGYIQAPWDAVFQSLIADVQSPAMAEASIRGLLADVSPDGYVAGGTGWSTLDSADHSNPPLASYALLKLYKEHGNRQFLEETFPTLYRWHEWWSGARDGNHNGLLEWGSNPVDSPGGIEYFQKLIGVLASYLRQVGLQPPPFKVSDFMNNPTAAGYESGLDNSQMWDDVPFNKQTHTMEQDDVGLNSIYALDSWALAEIAHILGRDAEEKKLRRDFTEMSARVNKLMWGKEDGMYLNKHWDGSFNRRISTTNFHPLLGDIASPERAQRMVQQYLLNPQKFWGEYVVSVTPRDDPAFRDNNYWRGRIWAPTNYLLYEGLIRSGLDEVAAEVAAKSTSLFLKEWKAKGHLHENYSPITGEAEDVPSTVSYYGWGGLLPLMMVEELIDVEAWGVGLRLGSLSEKTASVSNVRLMNDTYDVFLGPGLRVRRNGQELLESEHPVVLRNVRWEKDRVRFDVNAKGSTKLTLYGFRGEEKIRCLLPREQSLTASSGRLVLTVGPEVKAVDLLQAAP
jgi:putative isomerase